MGVSQAPVSMAFTVACCLCSRRWGCKMLSATCTLMHMSSHTQPPQDHPQPGLTGGLSATACFQPSAQLRSRTPSRVTTMGSLCHSLLLLHLLGVLVSGPCQPSSFPTFKTLMTAHIQAFFQAYPVSPTLNRADRWDLLKVDIQDVARNYCSTFHARRTAQLRALRVQASLARSAYLADPANQRALDELRNTAADLQ